MALCINEHKFINTFVSPKLYPWTLKASPISLLIPHGLGTWRTLGAATCPSFSAERTLLCSEHFSCISSLLHHCLQLLAICLYFLHLDLMTWLQNICLATENQKPRVECGHKQLPHSSAFKSISPGSQDLPIGYPAPCRVRGEMNPGYFISCSLSKAGPTSLPQSPGSAEQESC